MAKEKPFNLEWYLPTTRKWKRDRAYGFDTLEEALAGKRKFLSNGAGAWKDTEVRIVDTRTGEIVG